MSPPTVQQAISSPDPWLVPRMRSSANLARAEKRVGQGVYEAMDGYLKAARQILRTDTERTLSPAPLVAAMGPPDLGLWPDSVVWTDLVTGKIVAQLLIAWGEAFARFARAALVSAAPYRDAFLQGVYSRLSPSKWPATVWAEVQYEISEAMQQGESYDQMNERLGDLLRINALSRQLRARAAQLRAIRDNPDTSPADRAAAREELRRIYASYDEADLMWLYDVRRITRTETHMATVGGTYSAAVAWQNTSGEPQYKQWLATNDERTRETHVFADGQVQPLLTSFDVGGSPLLFPSDPTGPAQETIQCRCDLLILDAEEAQDLAPHLFDGTGQPLSGPRAAPTLTASGGTRTTTTQGESMATTTPVRPEDAPDHHEPGDGDDTRLPVGFEGVLAPLDVLTGDRRILATPPGGKLRMRDHRPLLYQKALAGGHEGGVIVGHIDDAWIEERDGQSFVMGRGRFDLDDPDGREAARKMRDGFLRGVSVDPDDITDSWVCHDGDSRVPCPTEDEEIELANPEGKPFEVMQIDDWRLMGATLVSHPAFAEALLTPLYTLADTPAAEAAVTAAAVGVQWAIVGDPGLPFADRDHRWDGPGAKRRMLANATSDDGKVNTATLAKGFVYRDNDADPATQSAYSLPFADVIDGQLKAVWNGVVAAAAAVQGARGGTSIPADELAAVRRKLGRLYERAARVFDDPDIEAPWDRADDDGDMAVCTPCMARARSLVAAGPLAPPSYWFDNPGLSELTPLQITADGRVYGHAADRFGCHTGFPGTCVLPPMDNVGFDLFHHGHVLTRDGEDVPVGNLIVGTDHAPLKANAMSAFKHYADTGSSVAIVRAGVDSYGIWVAGALTPDATDLQIYTLRRSSLSGDWREINGRIQFVAALGVNAPGYPIPRTHRPNGAKVANMVAVGAVVQPHTHLDVSARDARLAEIQERIGKALATPPAS